MALHPSQLIPPQFTLFFPSEYSLPIRCTRFPPLLQSSLGLSVRTVQSEKLATINRRSPHAFPSSLLPRLVIAKIAKKTSSSPVPPCLPPRLVIAKIAKKRPRNPLPSCLLPKLVTGSEWPMSAWDFTSTVTESGVTWWWAFRYFMIRWWWLFLRKTTWLGEQRYLPECFEETVAIVNKERIDRDARGDTVTCHSFCHNRCHKR